MARLNSVQLIGKAIRPEIIFNDDELTFTLKFKLLIMKGKRVSAIPMVKIYGLDQYTAEEIFNKLQEQHLVIVRGMMTTYLKDKEYVCPKCGAKHYGKVQITEISSMELPIILEGEQDPDKFKFCCNEVNLMGRVITDIRHCGGNKVAFKLKAERSSRLEGQLSEKYDYPWIRASDGLALSCFDILAPSSHVYLKGGVYTYKKDWSFPCSNEGCDGVISGFDDRAEVYMYDIEYLDNCHFENAPAYIPESEGIYAFKQGLYN